MNEKDPFDEFVELLLSTPPAETDGEYIALAQQYRALFGHGVPTAMLPGHITQVQIKHAMRQSIEAGEDKLLALLGVELKYDGEVLY